jgi:hypothetical protein
MVFGPHLSAAQPPEMSAAATPIKMGHALQTLPAISKWPTHRSSHKEIDIQ